LGGYFDFKTHLSDAYGLDYTFEYSPQFQWDLEGVYQGNDETNLILQWAALEASDPKRGNLLVWYQISRTLGDLSTSEFMQELGVITPLNGGDTGPDDYRDMLQSLTWEQWFYDDRLRLAKLTTRTFLNLKWNCSGSCNWRPSWNSPPICS
jgi:hypothetical protein